jgi:flagellin
MSKSMERLSSGYRINKASDDAAGLSIANRLRTNVRSLTVASRNVTEAKSMITTAEGAANQVEGILERMKELATQAASDNAATDRGKIQSEFNALLSEVDRIVNDTEYQGTALIKGTFGNEISSSSGIAAGGTDGFEEADISIGGAQAGTYTITDTAGGITMTLTNGGSTVASQEINPIDAQAQTMNFDKLGVTINVDSQFTQANSPGTFTVAENACGGVFQVGSSNSNAADSIGVNLGDMQSATLGIDNIDLTTRSTASAALTTIDGAINIVNETLGDMGAAINRMDYTYSNLQVSIENFSASESVIRDVDMAAEMVNFTKNQILSQAGTAMLAQANMSSQGVLSLIG